MSSTGIPTPFSELNQWELEDKPRMEDFNQDNEKIDAALEQLSTGKVDQTEFDLFAENTNNSIDGKADMQNAIYNAAATYLGGFFELAGLPEQLPDVFTVRFTAPARFTPGDKLRIDVKELSIVTPGLAEPDFGAFAAGALVNMNIDSINSYAYVTAAVSGSGARSKRFDAYDLPPSRIASQPLEWEYDSFPADIADIRGVQTVGDESYLFAPNTIYVYNHRTGENTKYTHSIATSADLSCVAYTLDQFVCFEGGYEANTFGVAINIDTKRINQIATTNRPTYVIPGKNGSAYAFGGLQSSTSNWYISGTDSIYTAKRGSDINSTWDVASVATVAAQKSGSGTSIYSTAPKSAAGYVDGEKIWFAVSTPAPGSSYPKDYARYVYDISKNTLQRIDGIPAFCITAHTAIPYGFEYEGVYYGVHGRKISAYDFSNNSVDSTIVIPDAPIDRPNLITVYKNTWVVFTSKGIYRLVFMPAEVPDDIGGVLEIYAGQKYRSEKDLEIKNKITIKPQWQMATEDIVIKRGEYNATGNRRIYVKSE